MGNVINIKSKVPQLRFLGFSDSWKITSIGSIAKVTSGGTPNRANSAYWGGEIPWVTTSQINFEDIVEAENYITLDGLANSSAKLFPEGTILLALYGQGITRGRVSVLNIEATTNQACAAILLDKERCDTRFIFYLLQSHYENLRNLSNDGGQKNLSGGLIKQFRLAIPDLTEQRRNSIFLSTIDKKISLLKQKHEQLVQYKKGIMQQLFSQQLRFKDDNGQDFPDWKSIQLKKVLLLQSNPVDMQDNEEYELITAKRRNGGIVSRGKYLGKEVLVKTQFKLKENQFVISKRQIVHGACGIVPKYLEGAILSNEYNVFEGVPDVLDIHYFNLLSKTPKMKKVYFRNSDGVHIEKLLFKTQDWLKTRVKLPSLDEQKRIVSFSIELERKLDLIQQQIEQTQAYKQGLLQQMFV
ncbi:MAG: restriction endonuclease subunit S [Saccharospirillaceae bacterium]|nr:restriction endonuclease subunit S [Saccharospirillaceae bacterium]